MRDGGAFARSAFGSLAPRAVGVNRNRISRYVRWLLSPFLGLAMLALVLWPISYVVPIRYHNGHWTKGLRLVDVRCADGALILQLHAMLDLTVTDPAKVYKSRRIAGFEYAAYPYDSGPPGSSLWWVEAPLGAVGALLATGPLASILHAHWQARRRRKRGLCLTCGYNLTGNTSGVCPECGTSA